MGMKFKIIFKITIQLFFLSLFIKSMTLGANPGDVVINEIAWMGTGGGGYSDEWIELYNDRDYEIDLSGWSLEDNSGVIDMEFYGVIPPGGYFLIENDEECTSLVGDLIDSSISLSNDGERLILKDENGDIVDVVGETSVEWYAGKSSPHYLTMERIDPRKSGSDPANWADNNEELINGKDAGGNPINGTPKSQNSVYLMVQTHPNNIKGLITEVCPGDDWLEIYITESLGCVEGSKIVEGFASEGIAKVLPRITPDKGDFIVLHFGNKGEFKDEDDKTGKGDNGFWDIYTINKNLIGTDNNITFRDSSDRIVDFVSFAEDDDLDYSASKSLYDQAAEDGEWLPDANTEDEYARGSVPWSKSKGKSIVRKGLRMDILQPVDTNSSQDWEESSSPGMGCGYGYRVKKSPGAMTVFQSPFSPYGDGKYSEGLITYNLPFNGKIILRIFDVRGRPIRTLIDNEEGGGRGEIFWDGRDDENRIVPIGIYICYLEAKREETGSMKKGYATIVVGRKL